MKSILPCLAALAWALLASSAQAQSSTAADSAVPASLPASKEAAAAPVAALTAGDQLLLQIITQLERRDSVVARLHHQVALEGHQLSGIGGYWQQGSGDGLRVRLELQFTGSEASLLQVSNGRFLWIDRRLPSGQSITRLDLRRIRAESSRELAETSDIEPGQAAWSPIRPDQLAHYGGLPKLLSALSDSFEFAPPQAMSYTIGAPLVTEATTVPVYATVGHWKAARLAEIAPKLADDDAKPGAEGKHQHEKLLARVPQEVFLLVRQSDLFPCRIEFRPMLNPPPATAGEPAAPYQLTEKPMALLELCDVSFDVPIAAGQFDYSPGDNDWKDLTDEQLDKVRGDRRRDMVTRRGGDQPASPRR